MFWWVVILIWKRFAYILSKPFPRAYIHFHLRHLLYVTLLRWRHLPNTYIHHQGSVPVRLISFIINTIDISAKWKPFNHNSSIMCQQRNHWRMRAFPKGCNKRYSSRQNNCPVYYLAKLTLAFCPPLRETPRSPTRVMSPSAKCSIS